MDSFELDTARIDGGDFDCSDGENDLGDEHTISRDEPSDEDQDSDGNSEGSDESLDDASVNDAESDSGENVASENSSSSSSDDDEEVETVSDVGEAAEDDEVADAGSGDNGSDEEDDGERVDTGSDDGSSDDEAGAEDDVSDTSGDSAGEGATAEDEGDSSSSSDDSAKDEQDDDETTQGGASGGFEQPYKEQKVDTVYNPITYQLYRPTNNYQSTTTYQSCNDYRMIGNHPTSENHLDRVPRCLPKAPALCDAPTVGHSHTLAGARDVHELYAPGEPRLPIKATHLPLIAKHSSTIYEMEGMSTVNASQMPNKTKPGFGIHELEGTASASTTCTHTHAADYKAGDFTTTTTTTPWVPTTFSNPNTILLDAILSTVTMPSGAVLKDMCKHSTRATIGISITVDVDSGLLKDGLQKYKTTEDGVALWWKPYKASLS